MIQPDYPSAMGLLAHLNSDELKEMLNDDTKFDSVLKDVKQVTIFNSIRKVEVYSSCQMYLHQLCSVLDMVVKSFRFNRKLTLDS